MFYCPELMHVRCDVTKWRQAFLLWKTPEENCPKWRRFKLKKNDHEFWTLFVTFERKNSLLLLLTWNLSFSYSFKLHNKLWLLVFRSPLNKICDCIYNHWQLQGGLISFTCQNVCLIISDFLFAFRVSWTNVDGKLEMCYVLNFARFLYIFFFSLFIYFFYSYFVFVAPFSSVYNLSLYLLTILFLHTKLYF